jgi:FAD/FMN-containing dehydrogenase
MNAVTIASDIKILLPGDEGWDSARLAYNLTVDQQPAAIALPRDAQEVAEAIRFAAANGLRVAPQRTGHNATPFGSLEDTLLLRTDEMVSVEIDPARRIARVGAGTRWEEVLPAAAEHGLIGLHGSTPDVSLAGYSLGGGLSWYGRKHGFQANAVTAIELVTADGVLRRVDADHEPELFWALRGGGGSFGVVTAIEFRLFDVREVYAGMFIYPYAQARHVVHTWHALQRDMPEEMTAIVRILPIPDLPDVPEPLRGQTWAIVDAAFLGDEAEGAELLRPLRELGPVMDTFAMVHPLAVGELHMDPPDPVPYTSDHALLDALDPAELDHAIARLDPALGGYPIGMEIRPTGGALGRSEPGHGALDRFPGDYLLFTLAMVAGPEFQAVADHGVQELAQVFAAHQVGFYFNFVEKKTDPAGFYGAETYARLQAVKAAYDPEDVLRANHEIAGA